MCIFQFGKCWATLGNSLRSCLAPLSCDDPTTVPITAQPRRAELSRPYGRKSRSSSVSSSPRWCLMWLSDLSVDIRNQLSVGWALWFFWVCVLCIIHLKNHQHPPTTTRSANRHHYFLWHLGSPTGSTLQKTHAAYGKARPGWKMLKQQNLPSVYSQPVQDHKPWASYQWPRVALPNWTPIMPIINPFINHLQPPTIKRGQEIPHLPSGKRLHNYGKSAFFMGKSCTSARNGPFSIANWLVYQAGYSGFSRDLHNSWWFSSSDSPRLGSKKVIRVYPSWLDGFMGKKQSKTGWVRDFMEEIPI